MESKKNPSRRQFLKTAGAIAAGGALGVTGIGEGAPAKAHWQAGKDYRRGRQHRRPNILLMMVDEMRYPPVYEAEGAKQFRQQYLLTQSALREHGVEFHRHYAAATACAPSRASLFTGQYPSLHGVTNTTVPRRKPMIRTFSGSIPPVSRLWVTISAPGDIARSIRASGMPQMPTCRSPARMTRS